MILNIKDINKNISGIYKIIYDNNKIYIGQARNIYQRLIEHNNKNIYPCDKALKIHSAYAEILEECDLNQLDIRESYWINFYQSFNRDKGYNICKIGNASGKSGVENINSAFTQGQLDEIVDLISNHLELSFIDIANMYDVDQNTILKISTGKSYVNKNLNYPLRFNSHFSERKNEIIDYFKSEQELINLKEDLKYRWDLTLEEDLTKKYSIPIRIIRDVNQGRKFNNIGDYEYPIRKKNITRTNLTYQQVIELLNELKNSKISKIDLGKKYNINRSTIDKINKGQSCIIKDYIYPARK